jgi:hypothetical protein
MISSPESLPDYDLTIYFSLSLTIELRSGIVFFPSNLIPILLNLLSNGFGCGCVNSGYRGLIFGAILLLFKSFCETGSSSGVIKINGFLGF